MLLDCVILRKGIIKITTNYKWFIKLSNSFFFSRGKSRFVTIYIALDKQSLIYGPQQSSQFKKTYKLSQKFYSVFCPDYAIFWLLILILMDYVIEYELRSIYYVQNHNTGQ